MEKKRNTNQEEIKFLADRMLGRLAKWLRIFGYDTSYFPSANNLRLILMARKEKRILLTRDTHLIKRKNICDFLFVKSDRWDKQLIEIIKGLRLDIQLNSHLFSRCSICNTPTSEADKKKIKSHIPPYVFQNNNDFVYCPSCKKYYWKGTHWEKMNKKIYNVIEDSRS